VAFTPAVKSIQARKGSREAYARAEQHGWRTEVDDKLAAVLADANSFYFATASADGQPYIQHRGGPKGFLKVIDDHTLAFADFRGNKQYISTGNLTTNNRVALMMIDYPAQARLKIVGRAEILEGEAAKDWIDRLRDPSYKTPIERVFLIHVEGFDWNCPQHITPRYSEEQIKEALAPIEKRMADLEQENETLRKDLSKLRPAS
jgi:predicted pyridoxine 5'-phosphate oxidase superfamily flavin-nucleotide-binding protein